MTEDKNNVDSTNPLPFEEFVRQTLAVVVKQQANTVERLDAMQLQINQLQQQVSQLQQQQNELRQEMVERFVQLSRQIKDLEIRLAKLEERFEDLEWKVEDFVKDVIQLKREKRNLQKVETA